MKIVFKRAAKNDVAGIVEVARVTFPQDFDFGMGFDSDLCGTMFKRTIDDPNELVCVALVGKKVVGFVYYINKPPTNGTVILEMIGVQKDLQGQGVGRRLIKWADKEAVFYFRDECGVPNLATLHLTTSADNPAGQRLYLSAGYQQVGDIPGFVGEGNKELVMLKRIGKVKYRTGLWKR